MPVPSFWFAAAAGLITAAACTTKSTEPFDPGNPSGEITVFAAASLTNVFEDIARDLRKVHPQVRVRFNFAGSQSLRTQITQGARPHAFASANLNHIDFLKTHGLVAAPQVFAKNRMVIITPKSNPANITSLADLPNAQRLVLAGTSVPAGIYAEEILANADHHYGNNFKARVSRSVVSRELNVRQTLQKVVLGEADAAIVYATDATVADGKITTIAIPREINVVAEYPVATAAADSGLGRFFVDFLHSEAARKRLSRAGFRPAFTKTASLP